MDIRVHRKLYGRDCSEKSTVGYGFSLRDTDYPYEGGASADAIRVGDTGSAAPVVEIQALWPNKWQLHFSYTVKALRGRAVRTFGYMFSLFYHGAEDAPARDALAALTNHQAVSIPPDEYYELCCDKSLWNRTQPVYQLDALKAGQREALRDAACPSVSREHLMLLYAAVWKACWMRMRQALLKNDGAQWAYTPVEVNLLAPGIAPEKALDGILRFFSQVFMPGIPDPMLPILSVTLGTSYKDEVNQPGSAAYFLINDGVHAAALDFHANKIAPQGEDVACVASMLSKGAFSPFHAQMMEALRATQGSPPEQDKASRQGEWALLYGNFSLYALVHDLDCALDEPPYTAEKSERAARLLVDILRELRMHGVALHRARAALLPMEERLIQLDKEHGHVKTRKQYAALLSRLYTLKKAKEFVSGEAYASFYGACKSALRSFAPPDGTPWLLWYLGAQEELEANGNLADSQEDMIDLLSAGIPDAAARGDMAMEHLAALCQCFQRAFARYGQLRDAVWQQLYPLILHTGQNKARASRDCRVLYQSMAGFAPLADEQKTELVEIMGNLDSSPIDDDCLDACEHMLRTAGVSAGAREAYRILLARRMTNGICGADAATRQYCRACAASCTDAGQYLRALADCFERHYKSIPPPETALRTVSDILRNSNEIWELLSPFVPYFSALPAHVVNEATAAGAFMTELIEALLDKGLRGKVEAFPSNDNWSRCCETYLYGKLFGTLPHTASIQALLDYPKQNHPHWACAALWDKAVAKDAPSVTANVKRIFAQGFQGEMGDADKARHILDACGQRVGGSSDAPRFRQILLSCCVGCIDEKAATYYDSALKNASAMPRLRKLLDDLHNQGKLSVANAVRDRVHCASDCFEYLERLLKDAPLVDIYKVGEYADKLRKTQDETEIADMLHGAFSDRIKQRAGHPYARYAAAYICSVRKKPALCNWEEFLALCYPDVKQWDAPDAWSLDNNALLAINSILRWLDQPDNRMPANESDSLLQYLQGACPRLIAQARRDKPRRAAFRPCYKGKALQPAAVDKRLPRGIRRLYFNRP